LALKGPDLKAQGKPAPPWVAGGACYRKAAPRPVGPPFWTRLTRAWISGSVGMGWLSQMNLSPIDGERRLFDDLRQSRVGMHRPRHVF
jgi:hypothetical protein